MSDVLQASNAQATIEAQIRECFGRVAYSHKTHEKCADVAIDRLSTIKLWQIILSAVTTGGLLAVLFGPSDESKFAAGVTALISTALLALNAYTKENDLGQEAQKHKETAAKLWNLRESYLSLLTDLRAGLLPLNVIRERRDELQSALSVIYNGAPRTSAKGYRKAQTALKIKEDLTFADHEIDQMLPPQLRRARET